MSAVENGVTRRDPPRIPNARGWNIATRTAHLIVTSVLVGGHVFDVSKPQLLPWLYATLATGAVMTFFEAFPHFCWFYQGRGLLVIAKLVLLSATAWLWDYRVPLLFAVIILASVGSHMPGRFRYYSIVHRRVLD